MFCFCSSLVNIDLSNFNTYNVTNMYNMFGFCSSLTKINLSNFNIQNVKEMNGMFFICSSLKKENIIIKDKRLFNHSEIFDNKYKIITKNSLERK